LPVVRGVSRYTVSDAGLLVYGTGAAAPSSLVWVARDGTTDSVVSAARGYSQPRVSPDGRRLVASRGGAIWIHELETESWERFDFREASLWPLWTPDGRSVLYSSNNPETLWDLYSQPVAGTAAAEPLLVQDGEQYLTGSFSADGTLLTYVDVNPVTVHDIWLLSMEDRSTRVLIDDPGNQHGATFSPDGRYIAYVSNESARFEVYVRPSSGDSGRRQVSYEGGVEPLWSPSGELFYRGQSQILSVEVETQPDLAIGRSRPLFDDPYVRSDIEARDYDVTPDAQRFLMIQPGDPAESSVRLNAVVNWFTELERLVPAD
jgi:serine/threonine-protein kinase